MTIPRCRGASDGALVRSGSRRSRQRATDNEITAHKHAVMAHVGAKSSRRCGMHQRGQYQRESAICLEQTVDPITTSGQVSWLPDQPTDYPFPLSSSGFRVYFSSGSGNEPSSAMIAVPGSVRTWLQWRDRNGVTPFSLFSRATTSSASTQVSDDPTRPGQKVNQEVNSDFENDGVPVSRRWIDPVSDLSGNACRISK